MFRGGRLIELGTYICSTLPIYEMITSWYMKDTATVAYTKEKGKYQFLKASNTDYQNLLMSQFSFDFVCNTGKTTLVFCLCFSEKKQKKQCSQNLSHFENKSTFWKRKHILKTKAHFENKSTFWKWKHILKMKAHFENKSTFWKWKFILKPILKMKTCFGKVKGN